MHHAREIEAKSAVFGHGPTLHGSGTGAKQMNRPLTGSSSTQSLAAANADGAARKETEPNSNGKSPKTARLNPKTMFFSPCLFSPARDEHGSPATRQK